MSGRGQISGDGRSRRLFRVLRRAVCYVIEDGGVRHPGLRTLVDVLRSDAFAMEAVAQWLVQSADHWRTAEGAQSRNEAEDIFYPAVLALALYNQIKAAMDYDASSRCWLFAEDLLRNVPELRDQFFARAPLRLRRNQEQKGHLIKFLQSRLDAWREGVGTVTIIDRDLDTRAISARWSEYPDFRELFDGSKLHGYFHWFWDYAFALLMRVDHLAALTLLNNAPHPAILAHLLERYAFPDRFDDALMLFREAPQSYTEGGIYIGGCAAPVLAGVIVKNLRRHVVRDNPQDELPNPEMLAQRLNAFATALETRCDLPGLGYALLQNILWQTRSRGYWSGWQRGDQLGRELYDLVLSIVRAIAQRLPVLPTPAGWVFEESDLFRDARASAVIAVAIEMEARNTSLNTRDYTALESLLIGLATSGKIEKFGWAETLHSAVDTGPQAKGLMIQIPASAVALLPDPARWFREVWHQSYWVRNRQSDVERSSLWRKLGDDDGLLDRRGDAAETPICWGLVALSYLQAGDASGAALWREVECAVREACAKSLHDSERWDLVVEVLAAHWPRFFGSAADRQNRLKAFVRQHRGMKRGYFDMLDQLFKQGLTFEEISAAHDDMDGDLSSFVSAALEIDGMENVNNREWSKRSLVPMSLKEALHLQ